MLVNAPVVFFFLAALMVVVVEEEAASPSSSGRDEVEARLLLLLLPAVPVLFFRFGPCFNGCCVCSSCTPVVGLLLLVPFRVAARRWKEEAVVLG